MIDSQSPPTTQDSSLTKSYIGRYAPSPTGPLHFGSLIAAVASYLDAKHHHGRWYVRIDDIDHQRCSIEHTTDILHTLESFGFEWDGEVQYQQQHRAKYQKILEYFSEQNQIFACECSRKILPYGPYPGTCLNKANIPFQGHAIRIKTNKSTVRFNDVIQGDYQEDLSTTCGDFVIYRADQIFSYHLASIIDDAELGVNQIIRGADLLDSTARQIYLQQSLGLSVPSYGHIPVVLNQAGEKLSKQTYADAVKTSPGNHWLIAALDFLGQNILEHYSDLKPSELLNEARKHWQRNLIEKCRSKFYLLNKA